MEITSIGCYHGYNMHPKTYWRIVSRDKIFVFLFGLNTIAILLAVLTRRPSIETTSLPFQLGLSFFCIDVVFALVSIRREPLLAYMFLTVTLLLSGTLYFFFRYLISIQLS